MVLGLGFSTVPVPRFVSVPDLISVPPLLLKPEMTNNDFPYEQKSRSTGFEYWQLKTVILFRSQGHRSQGHRSHTLLKGFYCSMQ